MGAKTSPAPRLVGSNDARSARKLVVELNRRAAHEGFQGRVAQFDNLATHAQHRKLYGVALAHLDPTMRVLDWGCGAGHFCYLLDYLGVTPVGYSFDPPPPCMDGKEGFHHVRGDPRDPVTLPFPDRSFDVVFSVGVLEHVHETGGDEQASLLEIRRILSPDGLFICSHLPNRRGWTEPLSRFLGLAGYVHQRRYSRRDIDALVSDAGLKLIEAGRYNFLPRNRLSRLPRALRRSPAFARSYDLLDDALALILSPLCQNWYLIAQRGPADD